MAQSIDKTPAFWKAIWKICVSHQVNFGAKGRGGRHALPDALNGVPIAVLTTSQFCANLVTCFC